MEILIETNLKLYMNKESIPFAHTVRPKLQLQRIKKKIKVR